MKAISRVQQKEQTKALLQKTAYEVFSQKGIMAARMADIAQAAGVAHGTVFLHFPTQEALIEDVIEDCAGKIANSTHERAQNCAGLAELLRAHLDAIAEYEPFYTRLVMENRLLPPSARSAFVAIQSAVSLHFSRAAGRELPDESSFGVPSYMLFNLWVGLVHHYLLNGDLFAPEGNVIRRYKDVLVENFMKLVHR